ncbi:transposase, partial [Novacetimonas pomaceti]|uniref:transposase n=1 Tax=Novacetimonas pomaceti TaxID=2021998 RepID=UPI00197ED1D7
GADVLLADLSDETEEVIGDRGYDSNRIRLSLAKRNITACIPPKKNRKSKPSYNWHLYKKRHLIENMFAKLKDWRRVATRYDHCAHTFMSAIHCSAPSGLELRDTRNGTPQIGFHFVIKRQFRCLSVAD